MLLYTVSVTVYSLCYSIQFMLQYTVYVTVYSLCYSIQFMLQYTVYVTVYSLCYDYPPFHVVASSEAFRTKFLCTTYF
jgi:hypothetical protein